MFDTINGFPVIAMYFTPAHDDCGAGRIVIVDKGGKHERRYVVGWQPHGDSHGPCWYMEWKSPKHCLTLQDARKEFCKRIRKEPV